MSKRVATVQAFCIRWLLRSDLPRVLEIEKASFEGDSWTEADFVMVLRQQNAIGLVVEDRFGVVGFLVCEVNDTWINIANIAVDPRNRRKGIGTVLIGKLKSKFYPRCIRSISLAIHERNDSGIAFFASQGFRAVQVIPRFFEDTESDAYVMEFAL